VVERLVANELQAFSTVWGFPFVTRSTLGETTPSRRYPTLSHIVSPQDVWYQTAVQMAVLVTLNRFALVALSNGNRPKNAFEAPGGSRERLRVATRCRGCHVKFVRTLRKPFSASIRLFFRPVNCLQSPKRFRFLNAEWFGTILVRFML
jgi:hypothetical protein